ncbi:MAG TPA: hypothetical protein VIE44_18755 [Methylomirabilota bacterium]|jgi:hypothetical protein
MDALLVSLSLLGLTALTRPTMGLFVLPAAAWLVWATAREARARAVAGVLLLARVSVAPSFFYVDVRHRWGSSRFSGSFWLPPRGGARLRGGQHGSALDGSAGAARGC